MTQATMTPNETIEVCDRCNTPVVFTDVSDGYYAVCPNHDEDLYKIEVKSVPAASIQRQE
ncbi:hypothetical protein VCHA53O466_320041 [Vibrio chagasii]|nr:hypothetical protein VCHA53O466_320041 [Vibrio chagasii]